MGTRINTALRPIFKLHQSEITRHRSRTAARACAKIESITTTSKMSVLIETSIGAFTIDLYTDGMHRPRL